ncbi:MAG: DNA-primase RepB domain-containing protein [Holophaga sp.]|nr:DNA-primase RepB domain-containing protein [Holophaga sp.]
MRAADHTQQMLQGWTAHQICRADLAVRRSDGAMLWRRDQPLEGLPLGWARAENAHGGEIYIRPARGFAWPLVFLDDLPVPVARQLAQAYGAMVIQTSPAGGCHVWIPCDRDLDEDARLQAQRGLAVRFGADKASVSGEHLGRLAGFKNWKRGGCWVNLLCAMDGARRFRVQPEEAPTPPSSTHVATPRPAVTGVAGDGSASAQEWGWVCSLLEAGQTPERVYQMLVDRAASRRGSDVERYALRTVEKALARTQPPV